eukprot:7386298-Prymnesium_polylepis.2
MVRRSRARHEAMLDVATSTGTAGLSHVRTVHAPPMSAACHATAWPLQFLSSSLVTLRTESIARRSSSDASNPSKHRLEGRIDVSG